MKTEYRTKPEIERFVFGEFVEVCPLGIKDFESRPAPEPDILCRLETSKELAFELTQTDDEATIKKNQAENTLSRMLMEASYSLKEPGRFQGYHVRVKFRNCKYREQMNLVPKVIETLNEVGPVESHAFRRKGKLIWSIDCIDYRSDISLYISVSSASTVGDYTVRNVKAKFEKSYSTKNEIHLLAWANTTWLPDLWRDELNKLCRQQQTFNRVWVFGRADRSIVFDSGDLVIKSSK